MSAIIERAAKAMLESDGLEGYKVETLDTYKTAARAALLAALYAEDEELVEYVAKEMASERVWGQRDDSVNRSYFRERARAVISALRALVS